LPKTYKCSFCGKSFNSSRGLMYVRNDSSIFYFCSSKCKKSLLVLKRDARKLKWTKYYGKKEKAGK